MATAAWLYFQGADGDPVPVSAADPLPVASGGGGGGAALMLATGEPEQSEEEVPDG